MRGYSVTRGCCDRAWPMAVPIDLHLGDPAREDRQLVHDRVRLVARAAVVTFVAPSRPTARGKLRWLSLIDRNAHMGWGKVAEDLKKNGFTTTDKVGEAVRRVTDDSDNV